MAFASKKSASAEPTAADILRMIDERKAELLALRKRQYDLATESVSNSRAEADYHRAVEDAVAAERDISRLQEALAAIGERDKSRAAAEHVEHQRGQLTAFKHHAAARHEAIAELAASLKIATECFARFLQESDAMIASLPPGTTMPPGWGKQTIEILIANAATPIDIRRGIAAEAWRIAGGDMNLALPGSAAPGIANIGQPHKVEPLADGVARSNRYIAEQVEAQIGAAPLAEAV